MVSAVMTEPALSQDQLNGKCCDDRASISTGPSLMVSAVTSELALAQDQLS